MINERLFGELPDKRKVYKYTLSNNSDFIVEAINLGCAIRRFAVPSKSGELIDIVLGYDNAFNYLIQDEYIGAVIGRHANRIKNGRVNLPEISLDLYKNDGSNHLHGGKEAFDKKLWNSYIDGNSVVFEYLSPDGAEGYQGNLSVKVKYTLDDSNRFTITYFAQTDKLTPCNLTNHSYFNLSGHHCGNIAEQTISINADYYTPVDKNMIPTGEILSVEGTPMDLRIPIPIGKGLSSDFPQIKNGCGYDCNWVLNKDKLNLPAASCFCSGTGIKLDVYTDMPCIQFYTGNFLKGNLEGKAGMAYPSQSAFCLETQMYPDSFNHNFPKALLNKGEVYSHETTFAISVMQRLNI